jgi:hypothetical protein
LLSVNHSTEGDWYNLLEVKISFDASKKSESFLALDFAISFSKLVFHD